MNVSRSTPKFSSPENLKKEADQEIENEAKQKLQKKMEKCLSNCESGRDEINSLFRQSKDYYKINRVFPEYIYKTGSLLNPHCNCTDQLKKELIESGWEVATQTFNTGNSETEIKIKPSINKLFFLFGNSYPDD